MTRLTSALRILGVFALGTLAGAIAQSQNAVSTAPGVTGIGGIFFKSDDPAQTRAWYRDHLGIEGQGPSVNFLWLEREQPEIVGITVWSMFRRDSDYFGATDQDFMINYRVRDLDALLARLQADGIVLAKPVEEYPYGRFAWVVDGDGRRIELWEPGTDESRN